MENSRSESTQNSETTSRFDGANKAKGNLVIAKLRTLGRLNFSHILTKQRGSSSTARNSNHPLTHTHFEELKAL